MRPAQNRKYQKRKETIPRTSLLITRGKYLYCPPIYTFNNQPLQVQRRYTANIDGQHSTPISTRLSKHAGPTVWTEVMTDNALVKAITAQFVDRSPHEFKVSVDIGYVSKR